MFDILQRKTCKKCQKLRYLKFFYFRKDNNKYRDTCKFCMGKGKRKDIFVDIKNSLKQCRKCRKIKKFNEFYKSKNGIANCSSECKKCREKYFDNYKNNNFDKVKLSQKQTRLRTKIKYPWLSSWKNAKQRCTNPNSVGYENYGGRGIRFLISKEEIKKIWFRDKAYEMKKPSIHRIDNNGDYEINNCIFMEMKLHSGINSNSFLIKQLDLNGKLIKEWNSYRELSQSFSKAIKNSKEFLNYKWITKRRGH